MSASPRADARVTVSGKSFRLAGKKFHPRGVTYGPFAPDATGAPFPERAQVEQDFDLIRELQANVVRVYHVPPPWFLDLVAARGLKLLVGIPWQQQRCFLDTAAARAEVRATVRRAVAAAAHHPAVWAWSVGNEIPPDIVRWSGARRLADFLDELVWEVKDVDAEALCTYTNYPPTEFLQPQALDFVCFNLYLHRPAAFKNYLAHLHMLADTKPLVLGELGVDALREGLATQAEILEWQIELGFRSGVAGVMVFSFTDDWVADGQPVEDWAMGLTTRARAPKPAFAAVAKQFARAPYFPLPRVPRVSVVVASYNADRTLPACLASLMRLNYPDYEVILVDDGSTDTTPQVAGLHPTVRSLRHPRNLGLSAARNTGTAAATGEIIAFTDADCRADEDWLYYVVSDLLDGDFAAVGGPNLLPPEDSPVAAAVMVSPGGPAHVMLTDREAEHIPGCNMAFYKWALEALGGFDPQFTRAGDDVDVCWRLQQIGGRIGFSPGGFVWHYRRSTIGAYLRQQHGYGRAEALLVRKHPEYFSPWGGSIWRGRIYSPARAGVSLRRPIIYHGPFGTAGFQTLYAAASTVPLLFCTSLEYHVLITLPLAVVAANFPALWPLALTSLLLSVGVCVVAAGQVNLPRHHRRFWSRPLVALLYFLQPLVRGGARYQGRLAWTHQPGEGGAALEAVARRQHGERLDEASYWSQHPLDRAAFVRSVLAALEERGWPHRPDLGWNEFDVEIYGDRWARVQLTTALEAHPRRRRLLRCRLRARWSLAAQGLFWGATVLELALLAMGGRWLLLLPLLTLPAFGYFLHQRGRDLQSRALVLLDELAKRRWGLVKVRSAEPLPTEESS